MKAIVAGGGIAGLACAYELSAAGAEVRLLEASGRLGGKIMSEEEAGVVFERGPDSFITAKPWALELARELGLSERLLPTAGGDPAVSVYTRGALRRYPAGIMSLSPRPLDFLRSDIMPAAAKLRMALGRLLPARGRGDESLAEFARRRYGPEALEVVIGPILAGIYAGDPERLSLASTFPQFLGGARSAPPAGATMFMSLKGGLSELVEAAAARLPAGCVRLWTALKSVERQGARWRVRVGPETLESEGLVLALPAPAAAAALEGLDPRLAALLRRIRFTSTATVGLLYEARAMPALSGFGFVVDRREAKAVMAATYSSAKFPGRTPPDKVLVRCFLDLAGTDEDLAAAARRDLKDICGISADPLSARVTRWKDANPQYEPGHGAWLAELEAALARWPGLVLAGSSYRGVGIPDCVRSGREAARRALSGGAGGVV